MKVTLKFTHTSAYVFDAFPLDNIGLLEPIPIEAHARKSPLGTFKNTYENPRLQNLQIYAPVVTPGFPE